MPEIHLFGLTIQSFGLCLGAAFLSRVARGQAPEGARPQRRLRLRDGLRRADRRDRRREAWYIAENGGPLFSGTGLVFYGGLIGGAIAVCAWAYYRGELDLQLADIVAPSLAAAYAIGRIGCQLAGDGDYGKDWDGPWAMAYPTAPSRRPRPSIRRRSTRSS